MGLAALLVADDQVFLSNRDGADRSPTCPPAISGLIEMRGTGIVRCESVSAAPMHYAVLPGSASVEPRLPPDNERCAPFAKAFPCRRCAYWQTRRVPLAILMAKAPDIGR